MRPKHVGMAFGTQIGNSEMLLPYSRLTQNTAIHFPEIQIKFFTVAAVKESAGLVMEPENRAALDRIEQEIIDLQNAVLELHKAKQQRNVTAADYAAQIKEYSQRMQELEAQQAELQTTENRYGEVKMWLDSFAEHIQSGAIMDADDSMIMKQLVEQIIVGDDGIEVHFKCGIVASHEYL